MEDTGPARVHFRTCTLCEAMCGIAIKVQGDRVVSIRGDEDDPLSRGYICPKAVALQDVHEDKDRLRHPVRRTANGFQRVSWDEAFDEVAARLTDIQARHGVNAVGVYVGNPTSHSHGSLLFGPVLTRALRTRNRFSATSVDQLPQQLAAYLQFGHQLLLPIPDIDRTSFLLILGGNPVVSNGSIMSAPGMPRRLKAIRTRGGKVVVVDPRRTETAELADRHHFIRPGADAFLLLGMIHTLFAERLVAPGRLAGFLDGLDVVERAVADFPPERVARATGIEASEIRALAREFAAASAAVCYGRVGACTQEFGGVTMWLHNVLNIVTGNLDRLGGAMFTRPAVDTVGGMARSGSRGHFDRGRTRVRGLPEFSGEYPVAALAEEILTEGPGQIRAMLTSAGNPVLSTPNGRQLDRAFAQLEFMVSIDIYINETTRHANIILPPTGPLEREHYDILFHALAVRNTAKYSPPLFKGAEDARHDWQILIDLATRISARSGAGALRTRLKREAMLQITPERMLAAFLRFGPYGAGVRPRGEGLTLAKLKREVHGVDLGPLEPCLPARLFTPSKRIALAPEIFVKDLARIREVLGRDGGEAPRGDGESYDLQLIGRRHLRSNNSWMHNSLRLVKGRNRCTLLMHPEDAARRGIERAQRVRVRSRVGSVEIEVEVSDEMMPGVVSMPHGWGHDRPGVELSTAARHAGVSVNDLTDDLAIDALTGNAVLSGVPVRVEPLPP